MDMSRYCKNLYLGHEIYSHILFYPDKGLNLFKWKFICLIDNLKSNYIIGKIKSVGSAPSICVSRKNLDPNSILFDSPIKKYIPGVKLKNPAEVLPRKSVRV